MHSSRSRRRRTAVAAATCLLSAVTAACGPAERAATPATTVEHAVDRVTADRTATVLTSLDAPASEVRKLLREFGQDDGERQARRLAAAEVSLTLAADRPLKELARYGPTTRLALNLCLGDRDVLAYKSVGGRVFLRLQLKELARNGRLTERQRRRIGEVVRLADRLPPSLGAAERFLRGDWVGIDPKALDDYGWAVEAFTDLGVDGRHLRSGSALLDGGELRTTVGRLERVLVEHSTYRKARVTDARNDVRRLRVDLPARRTAKALAPLLGPMGADLDARQVPQRRVPAELTVRRGTLAELRLDLGELTEGGSARVPLRLRFAPGDAFSTHPPRKFRTLEPQDLLAAALYGIARTSS